MFLMPNDKFISIFLIDDKLRLCCFSVRSYRQLWHKSGRQGFLWRIRAISLAPAERWGGEGALYDQPVNQRWHQQKKLTRLITADPQLGLSLDEWRRWHGTTESEQPKRGNSSHWKAIPGQSHATRREHCGADEFRHTRYRYIFDRLAKT